MEKNLKGVPHRPVSFMANRFSSIWRVFDSKCKWTLKACNLKHLLVDVNSIRWLLSMFIQIKTDHLVDELCQKLTYIVKVRYFFAIFTNIHPPISYQHPSRAQWACKSITSPDDHESEMDTVILEQVWKYFFYSNGRLWVSPQIYYLEKNRRRMKWWWMSVEWMNVRILREHVAHPCWDRIFLFCTNGCVLFMAVHQKCVSWTFDDWIHDPDTPKFSSRLSLEITNGEPSGCCCCCSCCCIICSMAVWASEVLGVLGVLGVPGPVASLKNGDGFHTTKMTTTFLGKGVVQTTRDMRNKQKILVTVVDQKDNARTLNFQAKSHPKLSDHLINRTTLAPRFALQLGLKGCPIAIITLQEPETEACCCFPSRHHSSFNTKNHGSWRLDEDD